MLYIQSSTNHGTSSPELEVSFWKHGLYMNPDVKGPPYLVPIKGILSQACRLTIIQATPHEDDEDDEDEDQDPGLERKVWATCGLTKVSLVRSSIYFFVY